ncbi:MAG: alpha/beta hydrolase [Saprospiraceae bacterium]|nr:alpha/beta hydrolase [Saprospiraceae bacterium]
MRWTFLLLLMIGLCACQSEEPKDEKQKKLRNVDTSKIDRKAGPIRTDDGAFLYYQAMGKGPAILIPNGTYMAGDFKLLEDQYSLIFYDTRNRGRSQTLKSASKLQGGIERDVQDMELIRKHFGIEKMHLIGHGYHGLLSLMYAKKYPQQVEKIIQVSAVAPDDGTYQVFKDAVNVEVEQATTALATAESSMSDKDYCDAWWKEMRKLYTFVPGNEIRALAQICQYPNENPRHSLAHYDQYIKPTLEGISAKDFKEVKQPVLMIHGTKDRVHSLDGAKKWAQVLPKGQLAQIEIAGHLPWMDAQANVFNTIRSFLTETAE